MFEPSRRGTMHHWYYDIRWFHHRHVIYYHVSKKIFFESQYIYYHKVVIKISQRCLYTLSF